jgi:hypothetical protein
MRYNKEKFKNAVLYLAKNAGSDVGKKKLAKLLYFIDFTLYELREKSLSGMDYAKRDYGPMPEPVVFYDALRILQDEKVINIKKSDGSFLEKIVPKEDPDMSVFLMKKKMRFYNKWPRNIVLKMPANWKKWLNQSHLIKWSNMAKKFHIIYPFIATVLGRWI